MLSGAWNPAVPDDSVYLSSMTDFRRRAEAYAKEADTPTFMVCFDFESFGRYVESNGSEDGDALMSLLEREISGFFPGSVLLRHGGGRLFLVCRRPDIEQGIAAVHDVVNGIGHATDLDLKAGILRLGQGDLDMAVACDRARIACESIAHMHDRYFRWFDDGLRRSVELRHHIESHIEQAIENGWIEVYFQPIVRAMTGQVCEFEALARWNDPRFGMISPAVFVDVLENSRLVHRLDAYVARRACEVWRRLKHEHSLMVAISVNLSRLDFALCDAFSVIEDAVRENGVPRQMLHVEITESAINEDADELIEEVNRFRNAGYQVWLDDFGSGYSSLNTLKDYMFDIIKIDMAFLRDFDAKPKSRVIIASIVSMAKQLGMQTLIEGVESADQYRFLREIGCEFIQGYFVGRPVPMDDNMMRIRAGEMTVGEAVLNGYYDHLGAVNTLSSVPFVFPWDASDDFGSSVLGAVPLAIAEIGPEGLRILTANDSFSGIAGDLSFRDWDSVTAYLNDDGNPPARTIREVAKGAVESGRIEMVDIMEKGFHVVLRMRHIASHDGIHAVLVSAMNFSGFTNTGGDNLGRAAEQCLQAIYDEVSAVDMATGSVVTLYRGNTMLPAFSGDEFFADCVSQFVGESVHPDDRLRCLAYLDLSDLDERMAASGGRCLADAFRVVAGNGMYPWVMFLLVPVSVGGRRIALICTYVVDESVIAAIGEGEALPKTLLWDTLVNLLPLGIFWKDSDRRFVGVNESFLRFYEFKSVQDVLGKNDEEMGWHVECDPFKNDELRVIRQGESIRNAHGTCISHGEVHEIRANKVPLRRGGEVVGLVGYFEDLSSDGADSLVLPDADSETVDAVTGLPNLRGLRSSIGQYCAAYSRGGPDFAFITMRICDVSGLGDVYGKALSDRILRHASHEIIGRIGVGGVVAHAGGGIFVVLCQVESPSHAQGEADRLKGDIGRIREIDGLSVRLTCDVGLALYSESENVESCLVLSSARMC